MHMSPTTWAATLGLYLLPSDGAADYAGDRRLVRYDAGVSAPEQCAAVALACARYELGEDATRVELAARVIEQCGPYVSEQWIEWSLTAGEPCAALRELRAGGERLIPSRRG